MASVAAGSSGPAPAAGVHLTDAGRGELPECLDVEIVERDVA